MLAENSKDAVHHVVVDVILQARFLPKSPLQGSNSYHSLLQLQSRIAYTTKLHIYIYKLALY